MRANDRSLPDPSDAGFYVRYVDLCRQAGVDPVSADRVRELVTKWNAMLRDTPDAQRDEPRRQRYVLLSKETPMPLRTRLFRGIALLASLVFVALLASRIAWPQQPARTVSMVGDAAYTSAGVGELGSSASVAWFIATPKSGDSYPIACKFVGESFTCKKGTFQ